MKTALQRSMAVWEKRNWIFAGTLLGWYRQCSLIPHDLDMDTASWIHDFEDWMIEFYRKHSLLKVSQSLSLCPSLSPAVPNKFHPSPISDLITPISA